MNGPQYPTCPKHMLVKPCMHCEPPIYAPQTKARIRRPAEHVRKGDRVYGTYAGSFLGVALEDATVGSWDVTIYVADENGNKLRIPLKVSKGTHVDVE